MRLAKRNASSAVNTQVNSFAHERPVGVSCYGFPGNILSAARIAGARALHSREGEKRGAPHRIARRRLLVPGIARQGPDDADACIHHDTLINLDRAQPGFFGRFTRLIEVALRAGYEFK